MRRSQDALVNVLTSAHVDPAQVDSLEGSAGAVEACVNAVFTRVSRICDEHARERQAFVEREKLWRKKAQVISKKLI